ncbi:CAF1-domain-containing protein [Mytilinidion resinicola]|uniref:CAF1-domain-containing protein n=1 Tax=Mytilinidion resinicola TaxID=574789 RepID=A0A6A6YJ22_9PEZI|nr:CAF1-domain-containing protein [Mytilinidion resinicola]KAF2808790.1 CAF1-domain-containing protein [Mytilinidion resinicola]
MEIDRISFPHHLLGVLTAISESHFVSIDLEFSGIGTRPSKSRKQTLEERYKETKEAAEKFQILQIGITCVKQDYHDEHYVIRPYNFNISPLLDDPLDQWGLERNFSFQSGACQFLLRHGFQMDLPFTKGVPYLSRDEAKLAKQLGYAKLDKANIADIVLKDHEVQAISFVGNVREAITQWRKKEMRGRLYITSNVGQKDTDSEEPHSISNFEKRLVHQLVRAEFPDLNTISKHDSILVVPLDKEREANHRRMRKKNIKTDIDNRVGFRWVVEALVGGDLERLDPIYIAQSVAGYAEFVDLKGIKDRLYHAKDALIRKPRVLVGHNMFTDLVYFYQAFIGALPDTVDEFQKAIHKLFPLIVDTKYLATHNCGDISPFSSLEQIEEKLRLQRIPDIQIHKDHTKYVQGTNSFHEAGYDSLLTANIMIRLSAKLESDGTYIEEVVLSDEDEWFEASEYITGGVAPAIDDAPSPEEISLHGFRSVLKPANSTFSASNSPVPSPVRPQNPSGSNKKGKKGKTGKLTGKAVSRFGMATRFDQLRIEEEEELSSSSSPTQAQKTPPVDEWGNQPDDGSSSRAWDVDEPAHDHEGPYALPKAEEKAPMVVMPQFGSAFWKVYGNKLRVFGTEEGVLELTG